MWWVKICWGKSYSEIALRKPPPCGKGLSLVTSTGCGGSIIYAPNKFNPPPDPGLAMCVGDQICVANRTIRPASSMPASISDILGAPNGLAANSSSRPHCTRIEKPVSFAKKAASNPTSSALLCP